MKNLSCAIVVGICMAVVSSGSLLAQSHVCLVEDAAFATGNGGCQDLATSLVWSTWIGGTWNWDQSVADCEAREEGGFTDWRLPTLDEMEEARVNGAPSHFDYSDLCCDWWSSINQGNRFAWSSQFMGDGTTTRRLQGSFLQFACVRNPVVCGDGSCGSGEDECTCPADCGAPPSSESDCSNGIDEDCDGNTDCADLDCAGDSACASACNGDGICDPGEDCENCDSDCEGKTNGNPSGRYCCGNGILEDPEGDGTLCDGNP